MTTRNADIAAAAKARCSAPLSNSHIMKCERTLRVGFFFDGFARHLLKDMQTGRVSNIGKLYMAHPDKEVDDESTNYRRAYLSGLGEDFNSDLTLTANAAMDTFGGKASEVPEGVLKDQATELYKDLLNWKAPWERLTRDIGDLFKSPFNAARSLKDAAIQSGMEVLPGVRDSKFFAQLFKTGVNIRIDGAIDFLNDEINKIDVPGKPRLKRIELSVYGFDFGAILARDFLARVIKRGLTKKDGTVTYYGEIELVITFAGMFDAVNRSSAYVWGLEEAQPLSSAVGDDRSLPPEVRQALHLVAAHERRFYRRSHLLASNNPNWREEFMPGISEDVGGSLLPDEQRPSSELALVSLHRMYRAAFRAGVPFLHLEDLHAKDADTAALFTFNDHIQGKSADALSKHYQQAAKSSTAQLKNLNLGHEAAFLGHTRLYIRWLAAQWHDYQQRIHALGDEEDRLHASQFQQGTGWFGGSTESADAKARRQQRTAAIKAEAEALTTEYGWLEEVDKEARSIQANLSVHGTAAAGNQQQLHIWQVLLDEEWLKAKPWPLPNEVSWLFEHFVHDKLALNAVQRGLNSVTGQNYFDIRGFDTAQAS
jgi:hypothetical protein